MLPYHYQNTGFQDEQSFVPRGIQGHSVPVYDVTTTHPLMNPDDSMLSYDLGNAQAGMVQSPPTQIPLDISPSWSTAIVEEFDNNPISYGENCHIATVEKQSRYYYNEGEADYVRSGVAWDFAAVQQQTNVGILSSPPVGQRIDRQTIDNIRDALHDWVQIGDPVCRSFPSPTWNPVAGIYHMHQGRSPLTPVGTPERQVNIATDYENFGPSASSFRTYDQAAQRGYHSHRISPINHWGSLPPLSSTSAHFKSMDKHRDATNVQQTQPRLQTACPSHPMDLRREQRIQTQKLEFHPPAVAPYVGTQQKPGPTGRANGKSAAASSSVPTKKAARTSARRAAEERRAEEAARRIEKKEVVAKKKRASKKPSIIPDEMRAAYRLTHATQQINSIPCLLPPSESEFMIPLLNGAPSGGPTEAAAGYGARNGTSASSSSVRRV